eukprot:TRINITY_DN3461_c0_g1_i1.p1 TRINITY_DN3461_c0_g1~~TRINITY_DN3461_c0_g1_i1.p1  ORF type:complete len:791 (-),score=99.29 TRINITY_DN3461_c0_g1_i1:87-2375(-)
MFVVYIAITTKLHRNMHTYIKNESRQPYKSAQGRISQRISVSSQKSQHKKVPIAIGSGILGAFALLGLCKRATMPLCSALRFLKYTNKQKYLSAFEKQLYVQRPEENEIASMLKRAREDFFVIAGSKKVGKSTLLRHMADTSLKKNAIYIKIEQKMSHVDELYGMLAKTVGYHPFYEESLLSSMFCFWRMFQTKPVEHHAFAAYLERVGRIYQKLHKGKLPIFIIDGAASLARDSSYILDDLAYMAKSLAESRSMIVVFGLLEAFGPCVLNSRGYNINKQRIYLPYMDQKEIMIYAEKAIPKKHPLRESILKVIAEENEKIYGGNLQYVDLLINQLQDIKIEEEIAQARKYVEEKVVFDIYDEMKKSKFKEQTVLESSSKMSMLKAFKEIDKCGAITTDKYLSFFNKEDQPMACHFLYHYMILREEKDLVSFQGKPVQYYIEKEVLKKYEMDIMKEEEMKKYKEMKEYMKVIEETIIEKKLNVKWTDLIGLEGVKQKMMETIILPTLNPAIFTGLRTPARGVLFYGPPGNGKTMVAKAVASECGKNVSFFNVSSSTFTTKSAGRETDKMIKALFALATERQPSVIFIDEMDSILSKRGAGDTEESRRLKNEFLIQFEGVSSGAGDRIVVIGATNRPFDIDDAILRRFSVRIYLDLPCAQARRHMIEKMMKKVQTKLSDADYHEIVGRTAKFSFADLSALCREASYEPIREIPASQLSMVKINDIRPVTFDDFTKAFKRVSKSVADETLEELLSWNTSQQKQN